jgi:hypothetical protein
MFQARASSTMNGMKIIHAGIMITALGLLSGCWYGSYPGPPQPPAIKTRACTGNDFVPPQLQLSRSKAKIGDTVLLLATTGPAQPQQTYDPAQNTYIQPDPSTCPKVRLVRFLIGDTVVGEVNAEPYRLSLALKAGEKGIPASAASNAGTTVDVTVNAITVYTDDKSSQVQPGFGPGQPSSFLSIEYP